MKSFLCVAVIVIGLTLLYVLAWSLMKAFADTDRDSERMMGVDNER